MTRHSKSRKWKFKRKNPAWAAKGAQESNECGLVWGSGIIPELSQWGDHQYQGIQGVPGGSAVKNLPASTGYVDRHRFDPWVGKIRWRRKWQPTPVFLPGNFHGPKSLEGYSSRGCRVRRKNQTTTREFTSWGSGWTRRAGGWLPWPVPPFRKALSTHRGHRAAASSQNLTVNPDWFHPSLDSSLPFKNACCGTLEAITKDFSISYRNFYWCTTGSRLAAISFFHNQCKYLHRFLREGWSHNEVKRNPDYSYHWHLWQKT